MESIAPKQSMTRQLLLLVAGLMLPGAILLALGFSFRNASPAQARPFQYGAVMLIFGLLLGLFVWLWRANFRLVVGSNQFGYRDVFGREHVYSASDVGTIVDVSIKSSSTAPRRIIYFLRPDGRRLMILSPAAWEQGDLDRLARAAGKPIQVRGQPMTAGDFRRQFPHAISWFGAHPNLVGTLLALALGAIVLGVLIATIWVHF